MGLREAGSREICIDAHPKGSIREPFPKPLVAETRMGRVNARKKGEMVGGSGVGGL